MADLTANANLRLLGDAVFSEKWYLNTSVANQIYKGQPAMLDVSVTGLYITPFVAALTVVPTDVCLGIAAMGAKVALGDPLTTEIEVYVGPSVVGFVSAVFTTADLGKTVYMSDSGTLSAVAGAHPLLGTLIKVEDGYCYVRLSTPALNSGA